MLSLAPAVGYISSRYGKRLNPFNGNEEFHKGIDISNREDTPIFAPAAGVVIERQTAHYIYGKLLVIDHGNNIITRYCHLSSFEKKVGQKVKKGEMIAFIGNSGMSTAPHLHYKIIINNLHVDPETYMSKAD